MEQKRGKRLTLVWYRRTVIYISSQLRHPPLWFFVSGRLDMGATAVIMDGRSGFHLKPQQRISKIRRNRGDLVGSSDPRPKIDTCIRMYVSRVTAVLLMARPPTSSPPGSLFRAWCLGQRPCSGQKQGQTPASIARKSILTRHGLDKLEPIMGLRWQVGVEAALFPSLRA